MFKMPGTFKDENEKYVVVPALRSFIKEKKEIKSEYSSDRDSLISNVLAYSEKDEKAEAEVVEWIDGIVKEGIKDLYIKEILTNSSIDLILKDDGKIKKILNEKLIGVSIHHICGNNYNEKLRLVKYEIRQTKRGRVISFYMCKMIHMYDRKNQTRALMYPIFVDLYVDKKIVAGRAKSKSNMYIYNKSGFTISNAVHITTEKEIMAAIDEIVNYFSIGIKKAAILDDIFRKKLYKLLDNYTHTPLIIQDKIDSNSNFIEDTTNAIINDVCALKICYYDDVKYDITNMVEKYFSISHPDKDIFINDREAYPLKIIATDEEESHVEQTAAAEEPLQSKAVFFDNKKMMQKSQLCDGVLFVFNRMNPTYFGKSFNVKIISKKDYCWFKFTEYTREDDIDHVLFSIIDA